MSRRKSIAADPQKGEVQLKSLPTDIISAIKFAPGPSHRLLASSWDCSLRLYDTTANSLLCSYREDYPLLDCVMKNDYQAYGGGIERLVVGYDFACGKSTCIGAHGDTVRCVEYNHQKQAVITGSWDTTLRVWDPRDAAQKCAGTSQCENKIYSLATKDDLVIVGTSMLKTLIWDLRRMNEPVENRDSALKYQTRCIRLFPDKKGFVTSSIEGRVAVEYLNEKFESTKNKYSFKCHRSGDFIHSVNALSFHGNTTLATGGSDGHVSIWDIARKKKIATFHQYPTEIAYLSFSPDGELLAIACSYLHETKSEANSKLPPKVKDLIIVRKVTDQETKLAEK